MRVAARALSGGVMTEVGNALQGWVAEAGERPQLGRRLRIAVLLHAAVYCGLPTAVEAFRTAASVVDGESN